jgi:hypothetical protein
MTNYEKEQNELARKNIDVALRKATEFEKFGDEARAEFFLQFALNCEEILERRLKNETK